MAYEGAADESRTAPLARRRRWTPSATIVSVAAHLMLAGVFVDLTRTGEGGREPKTPAAEPGFSVSLVRPEPAARPAMPARAAPVRHLRPLVLHAPASAASAPAVAGPPPSPAAAATPPAGETHGVDGAVLAQASATPAQSQGRSDFRQRLFDHIERFVAYPSDVRTDGVYGTAEVLFRMDRNGKVLGVWLRRTSGFQALDAAAIAAIWRAQPLPPIPADLPDTLDIAAPVQFAQPLQGGQG